ncbi:MAG TPA: HU family DNA-binding protein [Verrucomicrobiae bacterium]|nr:HU family DNA-binding protein [Verrucomicrobiae bacterium]
MKKPEIVRRLARQTGVSEAEAADRLDRVVHQIVTGLRNGRAPSLPGLGRFRTGADGKLKFDRRGGKSRG